MFHTSPEVWNRYGTRKGAWIVVLPYLPYLPYLVSRTRICRRVCARVCVCIYVIVVWKVWKVWKNRMNKGSATSIPAPYLSGGMECSFFKGVEMGDVRSAVDISESLDFNVRYHTSKFLRRRLIDWMMNRNNGLHDRSACLLTLIRQDYFEYLDFTCSRWFSDESDFLVRSDEPSRTVCTFEYLAGCWLYKNRKELMDRGLSRAVFTYLKKASIVEIENSWIPKSNFENSYVPSYVSNPRFFDRVREIVANG